MPARFPQRYDATGTVIRPGDWVAVTIDGKPAVGIVRTAPVKSRRVEVWVSLSAVRRGGSRRRSFIRAQVSPLPWLRRRDWPARPQRVAA